MQQNTNMNRSNLLKIFTTMNMTITFLTSIYFINIYLLLNLISHTGVTKTGKQHICGQINWRINTTVYKIHVFHANISIFVKTKSLTDKQFHSIRSTDLLSILLHTKTLHSIVEQNNDKHALLKV